MNQQNLYRDFSDIDLGITIRSGILLNQSLRCSRFRIYSEQDDVCNAEPLVYFIEINRMRVEEKIEPTEYSTFHDTQSQVWQIDSFRENFIQGENFIQNPPGLIFCLTRRN
jgi:hypothetical protein